ncbi:MAG: DUF305 domain-containing protein [Pseudooceanicola sp.]
MTYKRFALMIATSTLVMFGLMYLNTYAFEHVFYSETRAWMALLMGATMAFVMMGFMFGMYPNRKANIAILAGAAVVFAAALWLVRSQVTVSGPSYMRAMIPHHSIAVMTSERAGISDPRVRKLAHEIIAAQQKEIAEMRWLIADITENGPAGSVYEDPPAQVGTLRDALANVPRAALDPAPLDREAAAKVLEGDRPCRFARTAEADPILWWNEAGDRAVASLNGVILPLAADGEGGEFTTEDGGLTMRVAALPDPGWRSDAMLEFTLRDGPSSGYRGTLRCDG